MKVRILDRAIIAITSVVFAFAGTATAQDMIFYVDIANGSVNGDGESWNTAKKFLQDGLTAADGYLSQNPTHTVHIWVAAGTYRPDQPAIGTGFCTAYGDCDKSRSFHLRSKVEIYGGFLGSETSLQEREPETHITILSGDLLNNDDFHIDEFGEMQFDNYEDNSWHVVIAENVNHSATLDGFIIRGGARAAVLVRDAQPRLMDCVIVSRSGAAVRCAGASFLALIRCVVESRDESCPIEVRDESEAVLVDSTLMPAMPEMIDLGEHDGVRGCRVGTAHH